MCSSDLSTSERLLYDFSMQPGDSVLLWFRYATSGSYFQNGYYRLDSIRPLNTYLGPRDCRYLSCRNNTVLINGLPPVMEWIDEIGSSISPVYLDEATDDFPLSMWSGCPNKFFIVLSCAFTDGIETYRDS